MELNKSRLAFSVLILVLVAYSILFVYRSSFVINRTRYFALFDDMMISMRYANHLVQGKGLVWNVGERVEGFTNPLWTLYMAIPHLLKIPLSKTSLFIQISGLIFLILNAIIVRKILGLLTNDRLIQTLGTLITMFYYPLINWSLVGTEVSVLTLLFSLSILVIISSLKTKKNNLVLYLILLLSILVRIDTIVFVLVILTGLIILDNKNRQIHIKIGLPLIVLTLVLLTLFRVKYYSSFLPATYYLKMTGYPTILRITRGVYFLLQTIFKINWVIFFLPILLFIKNKNDKAISIMASVVIAQLLYSVYVGGDAWEFSGATNRYITIVMPLFFILLVLALKKLIDFFKKQFGTKFNYSLLIFAFILLVLVHMNYAGSEDVLFSWLLIKPPSGAQEEQIRVEQAEILRSLTNNKAKIAVVWAGTLPYFLERQYIDILGKNDMKIAKMNAIVYPGRIQKFINFHPGHNKLNYDYSIGELEPDVVVELWMPTEELKHKAYKNLIGKYTEINYNNHFLFIKNESGTIDQEEIGNKKLSNFKW